MIDILHKLACCGCSACVQKCPKQCISFIEDSEGFLYPKVNESSCVKCGLCEKVCLEKHPFLETYPIKAIACKNIDEKVRENSSSGGVFTLLAEKIIEENGVVFGVIFDENWECKHTYIDRCDQLYKLRGSKYLPSKIGNSYKDVERFLKEGRKVLFVGTSCQVAGLNKYLSKEYSDLFTVEVTCHGVPSPSVWRKYLIEEIKNTALWAETGKSTVSSSLNAMSLIKDIKFREKGIGWKKFRFVLTLAKPSGEGKESSVLSSTNKENPFMRLFIGDVILRPSCYRCPAKKGKTKSDITLADFWHIDQVMPDYDDDKGVTLVYANTNKALELLDSLDMDVREMTVEDGTKLKTAWFEDRRQKHPFRELFFAIYKYMSIEKSVYLESRNSILYRIYNKINRFRK